MWGRDTSSLRVVNNADNVLIFSTASLFFFPPFLFDLEASCVSWMDSTRLRMLLSFSVKSSFLATLSSWSLWEGEGRMSQTARTERKTRYCACAVASERRMSGWGNSKWGGGGKNAEGRWVVNVLKRKDPNLALSLSLSKFPKNLDDMESFSRKTMCFPFFYEKKKSRKKKFKLVFVWAAPPRTTSVDECCICESTRLSYEYSRAIMHTHLLWWRGVQINFNFFFFLLIFAYHIDTV